MKHWCYHIRWADNWTLVKGKRRHDTKYWFITRGKSTDGVVDMAWKVCPICYLLRPGYKWVRSKLTGKMIVVRDVKIVYGRLPKPTKARTLLDEIKALNPNHRSNRPTRKPSEIYINPTIKWRPTKKPIKGFIGKGPSVKELFKPAPKKTWQPPKMSGMDSH